MRRPIMGLALALALALAAAGAPAASTSYAAPAISSAAYEDAADPTLDSVNIWDKASDSELDFVLEQSCLETSGAACSMSWAQIERMPADIKALSQKLRDEVANDPSLTAGFRETRSALGFDAANLALTLQKITADSDNSAIQALGTKTDALSAEISDYMNSHNQEAALVDGDAVAFLKAAVSTLPVIGDVFSLGDTIAQGDVESGVVAEVSLVATAVSLAYPPAGAIIGAGSAIYSLAKLFVGYFMARSRDWRKDPPATPTELFQRGAEVTADYRSIAGQKAALVLSSKGGTATLALTVDSKWTHYNQDDYPVAYSIPWLDETGITPPGALMSEASLLPADASIELNVWQYDKSGDAAFHTTCMTDYAGSKLQMCNLQGRGNEVPIRYGQPAIVQIKYTYNKLASNPCDHLPCVKTAQEKFVLFVRDSAGTLIQLKFDFPVAITS